MAFLLGDSGQLFSWSDATWLFWDQFGIAWGLAVPLIVGVWAWVKRQDIKHWFRRNSFPDVGADWEVSERYDALVFTVSKPELPQWVMEKVKPKAVAFLATPQAKEVAMSLHVWAKKQRINVEMEVMSVGANDTTQVRDGVRRLLIELEKMGHESLAVDVTGGTKPMSLGAFMAAEECAADTLYVSSEYDKKLRKPDINTAKILCLSKPLDE